MEYSKAMRARMIKRMTGPKAMSATTVSQETGIPQPTLSRWLRAAGTLRVVSKDEDKPAAKVAAPSIVTSFDRAPERVVGPRPRVG